MIVGLGRRRYRKCLPNLGIKPGGGGRRHARAGRKPHCEMLDPAVARGNYLGVIAWRWRDSVPGGRERPRVRDIAARGFWTRFEVVAFLLGARRLFVGAR